MRVTNNMMTNTLMHNLQRNLLHMETYQSYLSSGKRVRKASDDPIDATKILKYKTDMSEFEQYEKNVRDSLNWFQVTESSVADTGDLLQRAREMAVQAANGTYAKDDLQKISEEIKNLLEQLVSNGNFAFAGKYVFSGYQTDKPLFKPDGTYNIDITDRDFAIPPKMKLLIGTGEELEMTVSGIDLFGVVEAANAFTGMYTDTTGDKIGANKTAIKGRFDLKQAYSADNLDVTIAGITYTVDETALNGTAAIPLNKDIVIDRFRNALAGGVGPQKLLDVADVYFDQHDNLVIESKAPGNVVMSTASTNYKTSSFYTGDIATKSVLKGPLALTGPTADYSIQNLDVTTSLGTFAVDESTLNGFTFKVTKEMVVTQFREALLGGVGPTKLSDVADIYFDPQDNLVIKERAFGALPITMAGAPIPGFPTTFTPGVNTQEATLEFSQFTFDDAYVAANEAEIKSTPVYITYNGQRKAVTLDPAAIVTTTAQYATELQNAIDVTFGAGKVNVNLAGAAPNQYFTFNTLGTTAGEQPSLRLEVIKSQKSSILEDMRDFYNALATGNQTGVQTFLGLIDSHLDRVLSVRADIGAKVNRMELVTNRLSSNQVSFAGMLSDAEDVDMAEAIMILKNAENVYRASLSTGGKIIQPSLVDFLR